MLKLGSEDLTNQKAALWVSQPMAARLSNISYLKQFTSKKMGAEVVCHFAKFLISNFLKGLTYSAMIRISEMFHYEYHIVLVCSEC